MPVDASATADPIHAVASARDVTGLYVHIPFCETRCAYCAFYVTTRHADRMDAFVEAVITELRQFPRLRPRTVFLGGGTPSLLPPAALDRLCTALHDGADLSGVTEWSLEANPASLTAESAAVLRRQGVTRISVGAQAFDDTVLKRLGRRHTAADIEQTVGLLRAAGFDNLNLDLIACVPGQTDASWSATLDACIALAPRHVSVYALSLDEGSALVRLSERGRFALLDDAAQLERLHLAVDRLAAAGYAQYEISNFARSGYACSHHTDCWNGQGYLGLGPSAASHAGLLRWQNKPDLDGYLAALAQGRAPARELDPLTPRLKAAERLAFGLRLTEGVPAAWARGFADTVANLRAQGAIEYAATDRVCLTARGRDVADAVGAEILAAV